MSIVKEFKEFALRGNVLDLAVAVIIGGAFGKIVTSMVNDVIMPFVAIPGAADFKNFYVPLTSKVGAAVDAAATAGTPLTIDQAKAEGPVFAYGSFITEVINFLILAACIFLVVKLFNTARKRFEAKKDVPAPAPAGPTKEEQLLTEIRDILAKK
jgi:large conductance mechanosensitive channel